MTFTVGETVVYPNHGAAIIEDIEMRTVKGEDREYLVLRIVAQQDLVVRVPACNLDLVGVRDVVDKDTQKSLGLDLVAHGLAQLDPRYHPPKEFVDAQAKAKGKHAGLWKEENPVAPWDWRKKVREIK